VISRPSDRVSDGESAGTAGVTLMNRPPKPGHSLGLNPPARPSGISPLYRASTTWPLDCEQRWLNSSSWMLLEKASGEWVPWWNLSSTSQVAIVVPCGGKKLVPLSPWITLVLLTDSTLCPTWSSCRWLCSAMFSIMTSFAYPKTGQRTVLYRSELRGSSPCS
jgi:hypothetical protein